MATLAAELEKAQKTLAEAKRLDTGSGGEVSDAVRTAELVVETLRTATQAAHRDTAAADETARAELEAAAHRDAAAADETARAELEAELEATREAHAKELGRRR